MVEPLPAVCPAWQGPSNDTALCPCGTAVRTTQLTSIKINGAALLGAACIFLELYTGKGSIWIILLIWVPLYILALTVESHQSQLENPHVCVLPCKYLFSLYISYLVWVFSLTLSCHMCGSWWHQLYEISAHAKNSWRSWNKFWVRWVSWAGQGLKLSKVLWLLAIPGASHRAHGFCLLHEQISNGRKGFDLI